MAIPAHMGLAAWIGAPGRGWRSGPRVAVRGRPGDRRPGSDDQDGPGSGVVLGPSSGIGWNDPTLTMSSSSIA